MMTDLSFERFGSSSMFMARSNTPRGDDWMLFMRGLSPTRARLGEHVPQGEAYDLAFRAMRAGLSVETSS